MIIGISSVIGVRAVPLQAACCASKHGVEALYESPRLEERRAHSGVRVTTVLPSPIKTRSTTSPPVDGGAASADPVALSGVHGCRAVLLPVSQERRRIIVGGTGLNWPC